MTEHLQIVPASGCRGRMDRCPAWPARLGRAVLLLCGGWVWTAGAWAGLEIQHWNTGNGARVYFVEARELPMVDVEVVFDAGAARDGAQPGIARMVNGMLNEGAEGLDADQIAERFESLGAVYGNSSLKDMSLVDLRSLSDPEHLQPAVDLLAALISNPDFPPDALERIRQQLLTSLSLVKQSPSSLGSQAFYRLLYAEHPYAHPAIGTEASVAGIGRQDLAVFHQRYFTAANAVVAIVGDLDRAQAQRLAQRLVRDLPPGEPAPPLPAVTRAEQGSVQIIEHPSTQSHLLIGQTAIAYHDPDYFPLYVGNHIFGGSGLVSILMDEIREQRGLSYSASSQFSPMRAPGPFLMNLQTRNEKAVDALRVARDALRSFIENGPTDEQLEAAKQNITGGFPLRLDSNNKILGYLVLIGFYGLDLDFLEQFNARVEAVTAAQIRDAFRRHVDTESLNLVVVGRVEDQDALREWLQKP